MEVTKCVSMLDILAVVQMMEQCRQLQEQLFALITDTVLCLMKNKKVDEDNSDVILPLTSCFLVVCHIATATIVSTAAILEESLS